MDLCFGHEIKQGPRAGSRHEPSCSGHSKGMAANTKEVGVMLKDTHGFSSRLFLKIGMFLQDGLAHQTLFSLKGHAGHKSQPLCQEGQISG